MSDPAESDARVVNAEAKVGVPFRLHLAGLSRVDRLEVRTQFLAMASRALQLTTATLDRVPASSEIDILRRALTEYTNTHVIPAVRERVRASPQ